MNPVYTWRYDDGKWFGQGTDLEFEHWASLGVITQDIKKAELLGYENPSEDEKRRKAWQA